MIGYNMIWYIHLFTEIGFPPVSSGNPIAVNKYHINKQTPKFAPIITGGGGDSVVGKEIGYWLGVWVSKPGGGTTLPDLRTHWNRPGPWCSSILNRDEYRGDSSGKSDRGVAFTTHRHLAPRLKKD